MYIFLNLQQPSKFKIYKMTIIRGSRKHNICHQKGYSYKSSRVKFNRKKNQSFFYKVTKVPGLCRPGPSPPYPPPGTPRLPP